MIAQLSVRQYTAQVLPIFGGMLGISTFAAYMTRTMSPGIAILSFIITMGMAFSVRWWRDSAAAVPLCMAFALATGALIGPVVHMYNIDVVDQALGVSAATFAGMAFYGHTTKRDLTGMGMFLFAALWGLIIASLVNIFIHGTLFSLVISAGGVVIFAGFTAYDMQRIRAGSMGPIEGAIALYLDFINLFLDMLRLLGAFSGDRD